MSAGVGLVHGGRGGRGGVEKSRPTGLQLRRVERPVVSWTAARWRQGTSNLAGGGAWNEEAAKL